MCYKLLSISSYKLIVVTLIHFLQECPQFWPSSGSKDYGPFTVTNVLSSRHTGYIVSYLQLTHRRQQVCLFVMNVLVLVIPQVWYSASASHQLYKAKLHVRAQSLGEKFSRPQGMLLKIFTGPELFSLF